MEGHSRSFGGSDCSTVNKSQMIYSKNYFKEQTNKNKIKNIILLNFL